MNNETQTAGIQSTCSVALILIDVINDFEFEDADAIFNQTLTIARPIAELKKRAKAAGIPVIYVNDNFGKWQSDFRKLLDHCLHDNVKGKVIAELLHPDENDYFVLKPKHSAFYATVLPVLLEYLKARILVLAGLSGNSCVLCTANDAFMRDFKLVIPRDCVASASDEDNRCALEQMAKMLKADTRQSGEINLDRLRSE